MIQKATQEQMYSLISYYKESLLITTIQAKKNNFACHTGSPSTCPFPISKPSPRQGNHYPDFYSNHFLAFLYSFITRVCIPRHLLLLIKFFFVFLFTYFVFFNFLVVPRSTQDLSSPTRDLTRAPCHGSTGS